MKKVLRSATLYLGIGIFIFSLGFVSYAQAEGRDVLMLLDASGSMNELDGGRKRIDIAKETINSLVQSLPEDTYTGLRVYGNMSPRDQENCTDSSLLIPMQKLDKTAFVTSVNSIDPQGWTPIDYSLRAAAQDLGKDSQYERSIVLVSDGEETCGGDPCAAARDLKAQGYDIAMYTIGYNVNDVAQAQLQCIAESTGGEYRDAHNGDELATTLSDIFKRASTGGYQREGEMCGEDGKNFETATSLKQGVCNGSIYQNETFFYRVDVPEGVLAEFSVSLRKPENIKETHEITVQTYDDMRVNKGTGNEKINSASPPAKSISFDIGEGTKRPDPGVYYIEIHSEPYLGEHDIEADVAISFEFVYKETAVDSAVSQDPMPETMPLVQDDSQEDVQDDQAVASAEENSGKSNGSLMIYYIGAGVFGVLVLMIFGSMIIKRKKNKQKEVGA